MKRLFLALSLVAYSFSFAQTVDSQNSNNNGNGNNSHNTTTIVNHTTIINNNNGNNNSNTNNASGTSGVDNTTGTGQNSNSAAGNTQGGQNNGSGNSNTACRNSIPAANFENLRATIKAQRVESNKPVVIKQAVSNYQVSVLQVKEMMKLISVEQYRLDVAKYLYDYTCDQANYFEVNALLNSSRVRDLEEYLKKKHRSNPSNNNNSNSGQRYNQQSNHYDNNDRTDNRSSCNRGSMSERDFDDLQSLVRNTSFSDSKQNIIKQAVPGKCISAVQVKQLMTLFSFEADKLTVAKYLYPYTSDQNNYFKVNEAFSFSTSVDELQKYIENNR